MRTKHWIDAYIEELLDRAKTLAAYGDDRGAKTAELHASELEKRRAAYDSQEISIAEACEESGYTPEALRRLRKEGKWSGRRGDLPRHARALPSPRIESTDAADRSSIADRINADRLHGGSTSPRRTG